MTYAELSDGHTRSSERVRDLAEVFTAEREVKAMLDLIDEHDGTGLSYDITTTYLEPACGDGNFLAEILDRKLVTVKDIVSRDSNKEILRLVFQSVASLYAIDIDEKNVAECRARLFDIVHNTLTDVGTTKPQQAAVMDVVRGVLDRGILLGDSLTEEDSLTFLEYQYPASSSSSPVVEYRPFTLSSVRNADDIHDIFDFDNEFESCKMREFSVSAPSLNREVSW